jgi:hypothetical protein
MAAEFITIGVDGAGTASDGTSGGDGGPTRSAGTTVSALVTVESAGLVSAEGPSTACKKTTDQLIKSMLRSALNRDQS